MLPILFSPVSRPGGLWKCAFDAAEDEIGAPDSATAVEVTCPETAPVALEQEGIGGFRLDIAIEVGHAMMAGLAAGHVADPLDHVHSVIDDRHGGELGVRQVGAGGVVAGGLFVVAIGVPILAAPDDVIDVAAPGMAPDILDVAIDVAGRLLAPVVPDILFQELPDSGGG